GQIQVNNVRLGTYTVTETVEPTGYALDTDPTRVVTVGDPASGGELNPVIGSQGTNDTGTTDESDFHNQLGSIAWEKRDGARNLLGGATFVISPDPTDGVGTMTVVDGGANDADTDAGQIQVNNVRLGTYTVTETVAPTGYALDSDATRVVTVGDPASGGELNPVIGSQGTNDT